MVFTALCIKELLLKHTFKMCLSKVISRKMDLQIFENLIILTVPSQFRIKSYPLTLPPFFVVKNGTHMLKSRNVYSVSPVVLNWGNPVSPCPKDIRQYLIVTSGGGWRWSLLTLRKW